MYSPPQNPRRLPRPAPTWVGLLLATTLIFVVVPVTAQSKTLSGRWQASSMRSAWNIGDWGEACGPRPHGGGDGAGAATITQQGGELNIQGPSRSYSTTQCWEQFPGMRVVSHAGGQRGWRTVCRTAAGDPRQATITTNITATDSHINFDEVGQYQFVVKKQNCTASVRRSRTFRLLQRVGEPSEAEQRAAERAAEETAPEPPAEETPEPPPRATTPPPPAKPAGQQCSSPGPPARLEVRPAEKLIRSGESFSFRATVLDAGGCRLAMTPRWELVAEDAPARLTAPGNVQVDANAPEGSLELRAHIGDQSVVVKLKIVSRARYDELLQTEGFDAQGESKGAAVAIIASGGIRAGTAVTDEGRGRLKLILLVVLGVAALVLGVLGVVLVRSSRKSPPGKSPPVTSTAAEPPPPEERMVCPTCGRDYDSDRSFCPTDGNRLVVAQGRSAQAQGGICPACGQGFDPGVDRCPEHGQALVPPAAYPPSPPAEPPPTRKICPVCGTQYPGDAGFCGRDGAQLVPVN